MLAAKEKTRVRGSAAFFAPRIGETRPLSSTSQLAWTLRSYEIASARLVGKYYPYGNDRGSGNPSSGEKFTGYVQDAETGLHYADQRYQPPGSGRFLSPDHLGGKPGNPGSWNKYSYAGGDPVNNFDPSGQDWCLADAPDDCVPDSYCDISNGPATAMNDPARFYAYCIDGVYAAPYEGGGLASSGNCNTMSSAYTSGGGSSGSGSDPCGGAPTQPASYISTCADTISGNALQYTDAVMYVLDENSFNDRIADGFSMDQIAIEDKWFASILNNRAHDSRYAAGGTSVNSQAANAAGIGAGVGALLNGQKAWAAGMSAQVGSDACTNVQKAYGAVTSAVTNGSFNTQVLNNWGLDGNGANGPPPFWKNYITQVDNTLFYGYFPWPVKKKH